MNVIVWRVNREDDSIDPNLVHDVRQEFGVVIAPGRLAVRSEGMLRCCDPYIRLQIIANRLFHLGAFHFTVLCLCTLIRGLVRSYQPSI